ncbi:MAG: DUF4349 domain-containing protein, partial [Isosphaeraceae bacterium]
CGGEVAYETAMAPASDAMPGAAVPLTNEFATRTIQQPEASGEEPVPQALPRKVIYNATISLFVEDATAVGARIAAMVKEAGGYVAETDISGNPNQQRQATWKVRVPVERFDTFLAEVSRLGELQRSHLDSQDVTQEYYDLDARIKNKQKEETRLLKHLDDSTGKLEDILAVERELTRVRGEVEQMQGRIRYLANLSSLSTVTITLNEVRSYTPPVAPTFTTRISRTFRESYEGLLRFLEGWVLVLVALVPWMPLIVVGLLILWLIGRRIRKFFRLRTTDEGGSAS